MKFEFILVSVSYMTQFHFLYYRALRWEQYPHFLEGRLKLSEVKLLVKGHISPADLSPGANLFPPYHAAFLDFKRFKSTRQPHLG